MAFITKEEYLARAANPIVWFTSDLHFGHERIIELCSRPFEDVEHMNTAMVERWNEDVFDTDVVFILGDLALGKLDESLEWVSMLNGRKLLVPGNHDRVWSGYPKKGKPVRPEDVTRYENAGIQVIDEKLDYRPTGEDDLIFTLCHFPDVGDSHDADRFDEWRPSRPYRPNVLVHGHVHEKWRTNGPRINVGVDVWDFRPVPEHDLVRLAKEAW